ncbi:MAG: alpha/beta fold hydrolase [Phycisphaerae bacterium]|nr:alpha/beta fold hydrolase [Phycisphaerae bacterium]
MSSRIVLAWSLATCLLGLVTWPDDAVADPDPLLWKLAFVDNPKLPPVFREFAVPRADGSTLRAYLAHFAKAADTRKPLMIYLDGSGAGSLFTMHGGRVGCSLFGLLARLAKDEFHVVAGEKRGVPFLQEARGSGQEGSEEYARHATYEGRIAEARRLLDTMLAQPAIDPTRVVVVGHSEGADVAAGLAATDPRVTHVAFLAGGGPTQMFDLIVLQRKRMRRRKASAAEIEKAVEQLERDYRDIFADPLSTTKIFQGHAYRRWASFFQHPPADNLLKTKAKLYVAHGSADESGPIESFDYLVVELIRAGRKDVAIRRFANRDHGFCDVDHPTQGPPMEDVFEEILAWAMGGARSDP